MSDAPLLLGIDPGTRVVGWGLIAKNGSRLRCIGHGAFHAQARDPIEQRLVTIAAGLRDVLAKYGPAEAAMEEAFYGRDARAAQRIGEGRGAILLVLAEAGLSVANYANNVVKKAVCGAGRASKAQVHAMVRRVLALEKAPQTFDAADALAIAICHEQRRGLPRGAGDLPPRVAEALRKAGVAKPRSRR